VQSLSAGIGAAGLAGEHEGERDAGGVAIPASRHAGRAGDGDRDRSLARCALDSASRARDATVDCDPRSRCCGGR
jgi:hypothetical protein